MGENMYYTEYKSIIGNLILIANENSLTQILINEFIPKGLVKNDKLPILVQTKVWLDNYFNGNKPKSSDLSLEYNGTPFQKKVLEITSNIPFGETLTYGEIAYMIYSKMSSRAVGGALGRNPIPIIIPCHRVLGKNNKLKGYTGGIDIKIKLLEIEGITFYK